MKSETIATQCYMHPVSCTGELAIFSHPKYLIPVIYGAVMHKGNLELCHYVNLSVVIVFVTQVHTARDRLD